MTLEASCSWESPLKDFESRGLWSSESESHDRLQGTCWCSPPACLIAQLYPTLCSPMEYSPPGSSVHGIFQARTLEWVAFSSSRVSSQSRDWTLSPALAGGFFTTSATWGTLVLTAYILSDRGELWDHTRLTCNRYFPLPPTFVAMAQNICAIESSHMWTHLCTFSETLPSSVS